jgi:hypothetical protein
VRAEENRRALEGGAGSAGRRAGWRSIPEGLRGGHGVRRAGIKKGPRKGPSRAAGNGRGLAAVALQKGIDGWRESIEPAHGAVGYVIATLATFARG